MPINRKLFLTAVALAVALAFARAFEIRVLVLWHELADGDAVSTVIVLFARAWAGWASVDWASWALFLLLAAIPLGLGAVLLRIHRSNCSEALWVGGPDGCVRRFGASDTGGARRPASKEADADRLAHMEHKDHSNDFYHPLSSLYRHRGVWSLWSNE